MNEYISKELYIDTGPSKYNELIWLRDDEDDGAVLVTGTDTEVRVVTYDGSSFTWQSTLTIEGLSGNRFVSLLKIDDNTFMVRSRSSVRVISVSALYAMAVIAFDTGTYSFTGINYNPAGIAKIPSTNLYLVSDSSETLFEDRKFFFLQYAAGTIPSTHVTVNPGCQAQQFCGLSSSAAIAVCIDGSVSSGKIIKMVLTGTSSITTLSVASYPLDTSSVLIPYACARIDDTHALIAGVTRDTIKYVGWAIYDFTTNTLGAVSILNPEFVITNSTGRVFGKLTIQNEALSYFTLGVSYSAASPWTTWNAATFDVKATATSILSAGAYSNETITMGIAGGHLNYAFGSDYLKSIGEAIAVLRINDTANYLYKTENTYAAVYDHEYELSYYPSMLTNQNLRGLLFPAGFSSSTTVSLGTTGIKEVVTATMESESTLTYPGTYLDDDVYMGDDTELVDSRIYFKDVFKSSAIESETELTKVNQIAKAFSVQSQSAITKQNMVEKLFSYISNSVLVPIIAGVKQLFIESVTALTATFFKFVVYRETIPLVGEADQVILMLGGIEMAVTHQNFEMYSGNSKTLAFTVQDATDISANTIVCKIFDDNHVTKATFSTTDGIVVTGLKTFEVAVEPDDTEALEGDYNYEVAMEDAVGNVSTLASGRITIFRNHIEM